MNFSFCPAAVAVLTTLSLTFPVKSAAEDAIDSASNQLAIFSQTIHFSLPLDWKLAFSQQQGAMYSAEFVPNTQSLHSWSSMLCVQGFKGMAENIEPQTFIETMAEVYLESCQGEMVFEPLVSSALNGHETARAIIGCTNMPNTHIKSVDGIAFKENSTLGEIGYYMAVRGKHDLFLIHKSVRGDAFNKDNPPFQAENYQEFLSTNLPISLN